MTACFSSITVGVVVVVFGDSGTVGVVVVVFGDSGGGCGDGGRRVEVIRWVWWCVVSTGVKGFIRSTKWDKKKGCRKIIPATGICCCGRK